MSPVNNTAGGAERANLVRSSGRVKEFWYFHNSFYIEN